MKNRTRQTLLINLKSIAVLIFILTTLPNYSMACMATGPVITISAAKTWNHDTTITVPEIKVLSGATLTINNCTVSFYEDAKITVRPGGHLIVSNSSLDLSNCGSPIDKWEGIVDNYEPGDAFPSTVYQYQGGHYVPDYSNSPRIDISNSTIQNSYSGVDLEYYSGIVDIENSTIKSDKCIVLTGHQSDIYATSAYNNNDPSANQIIANNLQIQAYGLGGATFRFSYGIYLDSIGYIQIRGNNIHNTTTVSGINYREYGFGVWSHNSNFIISDKDISLDTSTGCFNSSGQHSEFSNLSYGIFTDSVRPSAFTVTVNNAEFTNCWTSIRLDSGKYHSINNCTFDFSDLYTAWLYSHSIRFIDLRQCNNYLVYSNTFNSNNTYGTRYISATGWASSSGVSGGLYKGNKLKWTGSTTWASGQEVTGFWFDKDNRNTQLRCNEDSSCKVDIYIASTAIFADQPLSGDPPHNVFSSNNQTSNIDNHSSHFTYKCDFGSVFKPMVSSNVDLANVSESEICAPLNCKHGWPASIKQARPTLDGYIYPNPATDWLSLHFQAKESEAKMVFSIYDLHSVLIMSVPINGALSNSVSLAGMRPGVYVYKVQSEEAIATGKFIIIR
jgi:hypothetical protein